MKNFISSIYIKTSPISDEKICVGLFVGGEEKSFFSWSNNKLKLISKLVSDDVAMSLSKSFTNLEKDVNDKAERKKQGQIFISYSYSSNYFNYLSNYSKGLIEFKEPKTISKEVDILGFKELYKMYVGESLEVESRPEVKETFYKVVKSYLNKPIFNQKTDVFYKIPDNLIDTIYRPQQIDFISCNGNIFAGHSIDFTLGANTVESKLYEFRALVEGLKIFATRKSLKGTGRYIIYHNEPKEREQRKILDSALKDKSLFELKELDKIEDAAKTLESHEYKKFSDLIQSNN